MSTNAVTTATNVACPAGSTTAGTGTIPITGCSQLAPGYYIPSGAAASASPSLCLAGYYCPGSVSPAPALASTITVAAVATFGLTACPAGTTSGTVVASGATGIQVAIASYPSTAIRVRVGGQVAECPFLGSVT